MQTMKRQRELLLVQGWLTLGFGTYDAVERLLPEYVVHRFYYADDEPGPAVVQRLRERLHAQRFAVVAAHSLGAALLRLAVEDDECRDALDKTRLLVLNPVLHPRRQASALQALALTADGARALGLWPQIADVAAPLMLPKPLLMPPSSLCFKPTTTWLDGGGNGLCMSHVAQLFWAVGELDGLIQARGGAATWPKGLDVRCVGGLQDTLTPVDPSWWRLPLRQAYSRHEAFNDDGCVAAAWAVEVRAALA